MLPINPGLPDWLRGAILCGALLVLLVASVADANWTKVAIAGVAVALILLVLDLAGELESERYWRRFAEKEIEAAAHEIRALRAATNVGSSA
jgi:Flp pilus assembly protein TadB